MTIKNKITWRKPDYKNEWGKVSEKDVDKYCMDGTSGSDNDNIRRMEEAGLIDKKGAKEIREKFGLKDGPDDVCKQFTPSSKDDEEVLKLGMGYVTNENGEFLGGDFEEYKNSEFYKTIKIQERGR